MCLYQSTAHVEAKPFHMSLYHQTSDCYVSYSDPATENRKVSGSALFALPMYRREGKQNEMKLFKLCCFGITFHAAVDNQNKAISPFRIKTGHYFLASDTTHPIYLLLASPAISI